MNSNPLVTAADLIAILQAFPPDTPVCVECSDHIFTGPIADIGSGEIGYVPATEYIDGIGRKYSVEASWQVVDPLLKQKGMVDRQPCVLLRGPD